MSRTLDRSQGKFEAMPVSDGAPIVESGGNADGEWTRWSDGTQILECRETATGGKTQVNVSFPAPFSGANYTTSTCLSIGLNADATSYVANMGYNTNTLSEMRLVASTPGGAVTIQVSVMGRWK